MLREDHPDSSEMKCLFSQCKFDTDGEIDAKSIVGEKLQLMAFQVQVLHTPEPAQLTPAPSVQTATQRRKQEKFPRPTVLVDETRERWDNFVLKWIQYKEDSDEQFVTEEKELLEHMEQLAVDFQNPAVYVQEFLDISLQPDEGIRHFLSRLKGGTIHCDFSVEYVCKSKVSYADSLTKFKLVSGLVDTEIKEDFLGEEEKLGDQSCRVQV